MTSRSMNKTITSIFYNKQTFRGVGFNETIQSVAGVRDLIRQSTDDQVPESFRIEIEDENEYVELTNCLLTNKRPWSEDKSLNGNDATSKKIKIKVIEITADSSIGIVPPVMTTSFNSLSNMPMTNQQNSPLNDDQLDKSFAQNGLVKLNFDVLTPFSMPRLDDVFEKFGDGGLLLPEGELGDTEINNLLADLDQDASHMALKVVNDMPPSQRLQYPSDKRLQNMQANKEESDKYKSCPPTLMIPDKYAKIINADGAVDLISAVIVERASGVNHETKDCLAKHLGFWPSGKKNRPPQNTPFQNPYVHRIKKTDLTPFKTSYGKLVYHMEVPLCLMHAAGCLNDRTSSPYVRFERNELQPTNSNMAMIQLIPSHVPFTLGSMIVPDEHRKLMENVLSIKWVLRDNSKGDQPDWGTAVKSSQFTIKPRSKKEAE